MDRNANQDPIAKAAFATQANSTASYTALVTLDCVLRSVKSIAIVGTVCALNVTVFGCGPEEDVREVTIAVYCDSILHQISPLIYGTNLYQDGLIEGAFYGGDTVVRLGGNRMETYNWTNNASHAGTDYYHVNDNHLMNIARGFRERNVPGAVVYAAHEAVYQRGAKFVLGLPLAGFVAADILGVVEPWEAAPSVRFSPITYERGEEEDEGGVSIPGLLVRLVGRYGSASDGTGVMAYSLGNEPSLWNRVHPRIAANSVAARDLVGRFIEAAIAVKAVDPTAQVFGPGLYGWMAFESLQQAKDWPVSEEWQWFIDYFLSSLRDASEREGVRLLDAIDIHWYPEIVAPTELLRDRQRLEFARSLWDSTYVEPSWIGDRVGAVNLIPRLHASIAKYFPGVKIVIGEYNFGGIHTAIGGVAQAEVLGILARENVYLATYWGELSPQIRAAYKLYRNYDGTGGTFGSSSIAAFTSDPAEAPVFASMDEHGLSLHLVIINKSLSSTAEVTMASPAAIGFNLCGVWRYEDSTVAEDVNVVGNMVVGDASPLYIPPLSAVHVVARRASC